MIVHVRNSCARAREPSETLGDARSALGVRRNNALSRSRGSSARWTYQRTVPPRTLPLACVIPYRAILVFCVGFLAEYYQCDIRAKTSEGDRREIEGSRRISRGIEGD